MQKLMANEKLRNTLRSLIIHSPGKNLYEEGLIFESRLLIVNWIFQRLLGINGNIPWSVHFTSKVTNPERIRLGKGVKKSFAVSGGCYIQGGNGIVIGKGTIFAPGVKIISADHNIQDEKRRWVTASPVEIGEYCWLGANAVILPQVCLGDHVVVAAGAVVTKSFPANVIVAGVPAKVIRDLKDIENSSVI